MKPEKVDIAIVGAGILGTFHAYHALERGLSVRLFDKNQMPQGATVRNFGQIVPSGMDTVWQAYGRASLKIYRELEQKIGISARFKGTVYIASDEEEMTLLEELAQINRANDYPSSLLPSSACREKYPGLKKNYCRGGLFFPEEISVDPRQMIHRVREYLQAEKGLHFHPRHLIIRAYQQNGECRLEDSHGREYRAEKVIICNGSDFQALFPERFAQSDLQVTKLQMLQTVSQPGLRLPGNILTGLSIRRYESFGECPSYAGIKAREPEQAPWKKWGVHILFKQADDGSVILGDSHLYADAQEADNLGFDLEEDINRYLLAEAKKIFDLEDWTLQRQWCGIYSQCRGQSIYRINPDGHIHIVTGIGGKGMTASPAYARESLDLILQKS